MGEVINRDIMDPVELDRDCLTPKENAFVDALLELGDPRAAWLKVNKRGRRSVKEIDDLAYGLLRRWAISRKLNTLFKESDLNKQVLFRVTLDRMLDYSQPAYQVPAAKLAALMLGVINPTMELNISGETNETLKKMLADKLKDGNDKPS
jgi:hypothetical protein